MSFVIYVAVHISTEGRHTHLLITFDMIHRKSSITLHLKVMLSPHIFSFFWKFQILLIFQNPIQMYHLQDILPSPLTIQELNTYYWRPLTMVF